MHILAKRVVEKALAGGAVVDPIKHFDLLVELDRLARATAEPSAHDRIALADRPVYAGGAAFRRLSFNARAWLVDAEVWFDSDRDFFGLCIAYAAAHARDKVAFAVAADPRAARRAVAAWSRGLTCAPEQLDAAVEAVLRPLTPAAGPLAAGDGQTPPEPPPAALGPILTRLLRECGGTLDYWMWEISDDALGVILDAIRRSDEAEAKAAKAPPEDWMPGVAAFKAWNAAARAFVGKVMANGK